MRSLSTFSFPAFRNLPAITARAIFTQSCSEAQPRDPKDELTLQDVLIAQAGSIRRQGGSIADLPVCHVRQAIRDQNATLPIEAVMSEWPRQYEADKELLERVIVGTATEQEVLFARDCLGGIR